MLIKKSEENKFVNRDKFIYIPPIDLYFAKEKTHEGFNWYKTHEELQKEKLRMPSIPEFISSINYLRNNGNGTEDASRGEIEKILDGVLKVRDLFGAIWLDAKFENKEDRLYINYNHRFVNGKLESLDSEKLLDDYLKEDCYADVLNPNAQGFPNKKLDKSKGGIYFSNPRENAVARFCSSSGMFYLSCNWNPGDSDVLLGVYASAEGVS